jgi:hypothetical protein
MTIRKRVKLPPEVVETIRAILHGDDPDKLVRAFGYATGGDFHCKEVIEATPSKLVCLAECTGGEDDGMDVRAEVTFDMEAGEVKSISLQRVGTK